MSPQWKLLHPGMTMEHLGLLPGFFHLDDPRPAKEQLKEQLNDNYNHRRGSFPMRNFTIRDDVLLYPGDFPLFPLAKAELRDEKLLFYERAILAVVQPDGSLEVTRVDRAVALRG